MSDEKNLWRKLITTKLKLRLPSGRVASHLPSRTFSRFFWFLSPFKAHLIAYALRVVSKQMPKTPTQILECVSPLSLSLSLSVCVFLSPFHSCCLLVSTVNATRKKTRIKLIILSVDMATLTVLPYTPFPCLPLSSLLSLF